MHAYIYLLFEHYFHTWIESFIVTSNIFIRQSIDMALKIFLAGFLEKFAFKLNTNLEVWKRFHNIVYEGFSRGCIDR